MSNILEKILEILMITDITLLQRYEIETLLLELSDKRYEKGYEEGFRNGVDEERGL